MNIPCGDDVQSWVLNRLPLSASQKWDLVLQLKSEKKLTQDEIDSLNKQEFIDNCEAIELAKENELKKLQSLEQLDPDLIELNKEHCDDKTADIPLVSV